MAAKRSKENVYQGYPDVHMNTAKGNTLYSPDVRMATAKSTLDRSRELHRAVTKR